MNIQHYMKKVTKLVTGCWLWEGSTNGIGYGEIRINSKKIYAHRYFYTQFKGPILKGLVIDHLCRNPSCVNPEHLEAVTQHENVLRGKACDPKPWLQKTHCNNGHAYTKENSYIRPDGRGRNCVECVRTRSREWQRKKRRNELGEI